MPDPNWNRTPVRPPGGGGRSMEGRDLGGHLFARLSAVPGHRGRRALRRRRRTWISAGCTRRSRLSRPWPPQCRRRAGPPG